MDLAELFESVCEKLRSRSIRYAVAGGFAAVLYRQENRLTNDADIAIISERDEQLIAEEILRECLLDKIEISRIADLEGGPHFAIKKRSTPPAILIGRNSQQKAGPGIDFILSSVPWVKTALERAEENKVDFGFGKVPTLTLEDVVIAKLYALKGTHRPKDEDDLISIFAANNKMDFDYLNARMQKLSLIVPKALRDHVPEILTKISKDIEKKLRLTNKRN